MQYIESVQQKRPRDGRKRYRPPPNPADRKYKAIDIDGKLYHPKTELASYVQIKLGGKALVAGDIKYTTERNEEGKFVCTVEVCVMDGEKTVGEPKDSQKEAEKSAAYTMLQERKEEIEVMNQDARPLFYGGDEEAEIDSDTGEPRPKNLKVDDKTVKEKLQAFAGRAGERPFQSGDIVFTTEQEGEGYISSVQVLNLPEPHSLETWKGEAKETEADAEQSAAEAALADLKSKIELPAKGKGKGKGRKGKRGKDKDPDAFFEGMMAAWACMMGKGKPKGE